MSGTVGSCIHILSDSPLSTYQVSFDSLYYFKRYAPDKLIIAKLKKESNSVITCNRVTVLALSLMDFY